jgi:MFS transporter, DHA1 family, multidrug resistance protein
MVTAIITVFLASETGFKAIMGGAGDHLGRRRFILIGLVLSGLTPIFMRWVTHPVLFFPLRALDGIGAAALWPCMFASLATLTTSEERVNAMSVFNMMYMIGLALALPAYSAAIRFTGHHHNVFLIISIAFLLAAVIAYFSVPDTRGEGHSEGHMVELSGATEETQHVNLKDILKLALRSRVLGAMLLASFLQATGINLLSGVISIYAYRQLNIHPEQIGLIFILPGAAIVLMAVPLGWLGGRWGKVKSVKLGLVTAMLAMFLIPQAHTLTMLSLIVLPFIIGMLMGSPALLALITEMAPPGRSGLVVGSVATAQGAGAMIAPLIGGMTYDIRPTLPFYFSSAMLLLAFLIVWREFHEDMKVELS